MYAPSEVSGNVERIRESGAIRPFRPDVPLARRLLTESRREFSACRRCIRHGDRQEVIPCFAHQFRPDGLVRLLAAAATATTISLLSPQLAAAADSRDETLVIVTEEGPSTLDIDAATANVETHGASWNTYDRLITHARTSSRTGPGPTTTRSSSPSSPRAGSSRPDGKSVTFHLRKDANFHDGTPVTAKDVKWSFDRAVAVGGFPAIQMGASEMKSPDQFVVVDDHTIRVDFPRPNKLILPNLAVPIAKVVNSELAKKHVTDKDPWAVEWVGKNDAGGGAYMVESWKPGSEIVFKRFDDWKSGPLPYFKKVISRQIASAGTRRALLEKGDADLSFNLPPKDFGELVKEGKLTVIGTPVDAELLYIDMLTTKPPFDNPKVRQAVAYAIPYDDILHTALFDRGKGMFGGPGDPTTTDWPQPSPYKTDLDKAKALLAEAGFPDGFKTTLSYDVSTAATREPIALLVQDSLKKIGIDVDDREGARRRLVYAPQQEGHADAHHELQGMAQLPGLLFLLDL